MEKTDKKSSGWGGRREGSGRKPWKENPRNTMLPFRVTERTARRIKELRELTRDDTMPFVDMLEAWVEEMARDYGLD